MSTPAQASAVIKPLSIPPDLSLQRVRIPTISREMVNQPPAVVTPTENPILSQDELNRCGKEERSGRWSDDEHVVFLEGLEKHGKQWKTIALMIGTRTVVQVRTHAQKYFHKLERSRQKSVPRVAPTRSVPQQPKKRKSVPTPATLATTKKSKRVQEKLSKIKEATIVSSPDPLVEETHVETLLEAGYVATVSETDSVEESPSGLEDLDVDFDEAQMALDLLGDEPLEWLIDGNSHSLLPESSLPPLPFDEVEDALRSNMVDANLTMNSLLTLED